MVDFQVGSVLDGRYEILGVIGSGGMGCVYKARQLQLDRLVAIKIPSDSVRQNRQFVTRFLREARACAKIAHDHIVAIYDVHAGEYPYIVMEYVDGMPLNHFLHEQATTVFVSDLLSIIQQIAEGLAAAHAAGVIHRDIKPANIVITNDTQRVKIMDFGIARTSDETALTVSGSLMGTPYYMAPEQIRGEDVTPATDIYAMAGIVYQLFTGRLVFQGELTSLIYKHVSERPPDPSEVNPLLPKAVDEVLLRGLDKNPKKRQESPLDFCRELRMALRPIVNLPYSQIFSAAKSGILRSIPAEADETPREPEISGVHPEPPRVISTPRDEKQQRPVTPSPADPLAPTVPLKRKEADKQRDEKPAAPASAASPTRLPRPLIIAGAVVGAAVIIGALFLLLRPSVPLPVPVWSFAEKTPHAAPQNPQPPASIAPIAAPAAIALRWLGKGPSPEYRSGDYLSVRWQSGQNSHRTVVYRVTLTAKGQPEPLETRRTLHEQYVSPLPLETGTYRVTVEAEGSPPASPLSAEFSVRAGE